MIESIADRIAIMIKRTAPQETASVPVMRFALIAIINTAAALLLAFSISLFLSTLWETVFAAFAFMVLRFFSGGFHLQSSTLCTIASALLLTTIPLLPFSDDSIFWGTVLSVILLLIFAPSNIKNHARIPERYFPLLKVSSILIAGSNFIFHNPILCYSFLFQALLTITIRREVKK
ncbi:accessory gene regulator ArgB-like protein [Paenibacillus cisolokensis]|uniref:accessory gene regulator ArgB-like protein n=1 Tax=Paenibacillus cisolokensis TaxID=1658519 RepID=UPI001BCEF1C7|nr:accessory gene regulator B family protein [Paenibacillus cisolokensis]